MLTPSENDALETFIVMEYCDQRTLRCKLKVVWDLLRSQYPAGLHYVLSCLRDIAMGAEYLHTLGLVHGDLKDSNVLLQSTRSNPRGFTCKVADLGCSRLLSLGQLDAAEVTTQTKGTACYAAPELLRDGTLTQVWHRPFKMLLPEDAHILAAF